MSSAVDMEHQQAVIFQESVSVHRRRLRRGVHPPPPAVEWGRFIIAFWVLKKKVLCEKDCGETTLKQ